MEKRGNNLRSEREIKRESVREREKERERKRERERMFLDLNNIYWVWEPSTQ